MSEKNSYTFPKALITNSDLNNKFHQEEGNKLYTKKDPRLTFRKMPRMKSEIIIQAEKNLKRVTLSSQSYSQYMKINKKIIMKFAFKGKKSRVYSAIGDLTQRRNQNQKNMNKNLPNLTYRKSDIHEFIKERKKINHFNSERNRDININIVDNDSLDDINSNEENENNNIEEMPYGFKYKETRIILDKNKLGPIKSAIFPNDNNININNINEEEYKNITNIKEIKREKEKENHKKYILKDKLKKKEEEKNKTFKFFFDGDFLEKNTKLLKKRNKTEFVLKYEESNNYLAELYDICKNMEKFSGKDFQRKMVYNFKNNNHTEEFAYELTFNSLCLKFIEQNKNKNLDENIKEKSHKVFLPFTYLLFFYLLDFETFKIFLSEIIIFNEVKEEMEINQKEIRNVLIKYKKYIQFILGPYFNPGKKKDIDNKEFYHNASYNWNERNFLKIYDWIVNINSGNRDGSNIQDKNNNIIYKVKIILPTIKFNLIKKKVVIKKLIHKNIITKLLKTGLKKWEEKILCELFFNKKFRYIMNGIYSKNYQKTHSYKKRKIYLDKIDYNNNILNRNKYEFFISDAKREHSQYLYISSYEILLFYGRNKEKFNINKHMSIKDSINLNKYSLYWGYMNTIMKCCHIDNKNKRVLFDFNILEKDTTKYFQLKLKTKYGLGIIDKNNLENLTNFYNQGYMFYRKEELLVDIYFINFIIIEPCITRLNFQEYKFRVPKDLLDIIISDKNSINNLNSYISMFSEEILSNNGILNLNLGDFKRRVDNKNLSKGMQERLKRFSLGLINKSNTIKFPSSSMNVNTDIKKTNSNFKRGVSSGGMGSLFGNSLLNVAGNYKKSETKKFGGSLFINNNKIDETKTMENKKVPKKLSIWKGVHLLKKPEKKNEIQEIKEIKESKEIQEKKLNRQISFFNPVNINITENDNDKIKEEKEKERTRKYKKMNTKMKSKFIERGEYFKQYMDDIKKQAEVKYIDVEGNELFK